MKRTNFGIVVLSLLVLGSSEASAEAIYSTFGPGDTYNVSEGWSVNLTNTGRQDVAMPFTVLGSNYTFTSVELALFGGQGALDIQLLSDAAGLPGSVIETISLLNPSGITTATSGLSPTLISGSTYWIATHAFNGGYAGAWNENDQGLTGNAGFSGDNGASWFTTPSDFSAFRVNGVAQAAPVPEPSALTLAALGVVSFGGMAWRKLMA